MTFSLIFFLSIQDCDHVSRTLEEFYTVRCQVADMRNLYESLDEVTVKDTLEGDNMYTCSQCGKKVRAEKRYFCFDYPQNKTKSTKALFLIIKILL